ncbi:hypothetical protein C8F04DRAFT_1399024 [Mycena alexandri]|uniref:CCHC-type domain-containing protein n=1 Tax=Mycena alexandri TaxID=1745969 RepID=A0AAD6SHY8_9AGAR|nr:hypothetical protein C8F04DRAFT_1399024 [Mycena alexandri]
MLSHSRILSARLLFDSALHIVWYRLTSAKRLAQPADKLWDGLASSIQLPCSERLAGPLSQKLPNESAYVFYLRPGGSHWERLSESPDEAYANMFLLWRTRTHRKRLPERVHTKMFLLWRTGTHCRKLPHASTTVRLLRRNGSLSPKLPNESAQVLYLRPEGGHIGRECPTLIPLPSVRDSPAAPPKCSSCGEIGHSERNWVETCSTCGYMGHSIEDCPKSPCSYCNERGHIERDCARKHALDFITED